MRAKPRFNRRDLPQAYRDLEQWPTVNVARLGKKKAVFNRRKAAIRAYFGGVKESDIWSQYRIPRQELARLRKRCLELHPDGRIWGYRALVPQKWLRQYERKAPIESATLHQRSGYSGALGQLFERFEDIRKLVEDLFTDDIKKQLKSNPRCEPRIRYKWLHKQFIDACRAHGLTARDWPLNADYRGQQSLTRYVKKLFKKMYRKATKARFGENAAKKLLVGTGESDRLPLQLYQRVELDAHKLHAFCTLEIPDLDGEPIPRVLHRLWIIVVIESVSRAVLGYYVSLGLEADTYDLLNAIKNAIAPWKLRELKIPGIRYADTWGFPSGRFKPLAWAAWSELLFDNARINLAKDTQALIEDVVGCAVNPGPAGQPDRRPLIECLFRVLEENGFHRLFSTTGSGPKDSRRNNPEAQAIKYRITLDHLEELIDVALARYNGTAHSGIRERTPLEMLEYRLSKGDLVRTLLPEERTDLALLNYRTNRRVSGNLREGRRPYVTFEGAKYTSSVLAQSPDLIGKYVDLLIDRDDVRTVTAYFEDGTELGELTANAPWDRTPHTLEMRRAIRRLKKRGVIQYTDEDDIFGIYNQHLLEQAPTQKRARAAYAKARRAFERHGVEMPSRPSVPETPPSPAPARDYDAMMKRFKTFRHDGGKG